MTTKQEIEELKKRIEELERRPQYIPYYSPLQTQPNLIYNQMRCQNCGQVLYQNQLHQCYSIGNTQNCQTQPQR